MTSGIPPASPLDSEAVRSEAFRLMVESVIDYSIFLLDPRGVILTWNEGARKMKGYTSSEIIGTHFSRFYPEEDQAAHKPERELQEAIEKGRVEDEGWRVRKDGTRFWANVVITALRTGDGNVWGFGKVTRDLTARRAAEESKRQLAVEHGLRQLAEAGQRDAERARLRAARLQNLAAELSRSASPGAVATAVLAQGMDYLKAAGGLICRQDPERRHLEVMASSGDVLPIAQSLVDDPAAAGDPIAEVARSGAPILFSNREQVGRAYPRTRLLEGWPSMAGLVLFPLHDREGPSGVLLLGFAEPRDLDPESLGFLQILAEYASQALDRARLYQDLLAARQLAERAAKRLNFLSEASRILGSSIDYQTTLRNVVEYSVPAFADWAAVDLLSGPAFTRVAVKHLDPAKVELAHELFRRSPPKPTDPEGLAEVIRSGKSQFVPEIPEALVRSSVADPEMLRIYLELGLRSAIVVPMLVQGRAVGAITFVMAESDRRYKPEDLVIAEDLGRRAGVAVENSRLYRESQEASRSKDEFLAVVSHELRTPLTAILGYASMLRKGDIGGERREKALEVIERNARAQTQLIGDLMDVSRITSGKLRLDVRTLPNLGAIVEAALDSVRPAAEARGIRLSSVLDPRAGPIAGDSDRLQQVVWNLLVNAIKFSPREGRVQVHLSRINSHVELSVTDNGEGIDSDFLSVIFERFRQADSSFTRRHGGLGLGLSIVKNVVELHGGTVEAHSGGLGKGATFVVKLPLAPVHPTGPAHPPREHPTVSQAPVYDPGDVLKGLTILIVDDDQDSQEVVGSILEQSSANVLMASSSSEALELIRARRPDLIISDIGMPNEDGHAFIRRVRALPADQGGETPAVALTAYARVEDRTQALLAGFQMHVPKPVEATELVVVAASLVRRRSS